MSGPAVCLAVGGSDSCGGAGIQADLAVFARIGVAGCSATTALTAQNPERILRIEPSPPAQFGAELQAILSYYTVAAVKTGMLVDAGHIGVLAEAMAHHRVSCPLVVDPVMVSTSGTTLLDPAGVAALQSVLFPQASLITPNLPEAESLLGSPIDDPVEAAAELVRRFRRPVLLKGGHGRGDALVDVLCMADGDVHLFEHPRLNWGRDQAHGSGCRLAAAIAAYLALQATV
ncbi:MAG TPA: hydroxymethylpyrimidine/phosphomethylpyrimidine kinase, partial [Mariprofundaceae bacterium]|nr:hydroxymethylpyrimidine/phosphomethylpyrimidine kinase [Mariprofundaceae bacterium]